MEPRESRADPQDQLQGASLQDRRLRPRLTEADARRGARARGGGGMRRGKTLPELAVADVVSHREVPSTAPPMAAKITTSHGGTAHSASSANVISASARAAGVGIAVVHTGRESAATSSPTTAAL